MKKFLFIAILGAFTITILQAQPNVAEEITEAERIIDKYSKKFSEAFVSIAEGFQQPAEHVYKILVKQQVIYAFESLFLIILPFMTMVFSIIGIKSEMKYIKTENEKIIEYNNKEGNYNSKEKLTTERPIFIMSAVGAGISAIFIVVVCTSCIEPMLTGFINPEYGAIMSIMDMIK